MRKSTTFEIGKMTIVSNELTPRQVDELLGKTEANKAASWLSVLLASDITTDAVVMSTGISEDSLLDDFTLEQLAVVWRKVEDVNGFLLERLKLTFEKIQRIMEEKISENLSVG